jgi:hypothetical protein
MRRSGYHVAWLFVARLYRFNLPLALLLNSRGAMLMPDPGIVLVVASGLLALATAIRATSPF